MTILVINGPNLNMLGIREPDIYGKRTYADLEAMIKEKCEKDGIKVRIIQSNHEGEIVEFIQAAYKKYDGIVINRRLYPHKRRYP